MNDDGDEGVFGAFGIGAVFFGARTIEANHGIFHSEDGTVDRNGDRIRVIEDELRIDIQSMNDGVSRVFAPKWLGFIRIKRHCPNGLLVRDELVSNGVPNELFG